MENQTEETIEIPAQTTEPTPQPAEKTKTQQFKEALEQYSDRETAKSHIKEIAQKLNCRKSLGYKAIKEIVFPNEQGQPPPAQEPTARIPEQPPEPFAETPAQAEITPTPEQPIEAAEVPTTPQPPEVISPTVQKLEPILERSIKRLFNSAIENLTGAQETLTDQESKDTAILLPIVVYRLTKVRLSEDQFIDMTCVTHFGSIILKVVAPRIKEFLRPKPEAPEPKTRRKEPKPEPEPEPDRAQQTLTPEPPAPAEPTAQEKPKGQEILDKLGKAV